MTATTRPRGLTAQDIMRGAVVSVGIDESLESAGRALLAWRFPSVPVRGPGDHLVGMLSDVDCMRKLADRLRVGSPAGTVGQVMSPDVVSVAADADLLTMSETFASYRHNAVPVKDAVGNVCGVVSRRDVLAALCREVSAVRG